jgi:hypothetical protein
MNKFQIAQLNSAKKSVESCNKRIEYYEEKIRKSQDLYAVELESCKQLKEVHLNTIKMIEDSVVTQEEEKEETIPSNDVPSTGNTIPDAWLNN